MKIKGITDECFSDYKLPALFIAFPYCTFKCDAENNCKMCQNSQLANEPNIEITKEKLIERFLSNPITEAIVFGGLEPFDSLLDIESFVDSLRRQYQNNAPIVIYTGYTEEEILNGTFNANPAVAKNIVSDLLKQKNIIIKYGRFRPYQEKHFDEILGVYLASPNQYARQYD